MENDAKSWSGDNKITGGAGSSVTFSLGDSLPRGSLKMGNLRKKERLEGSGTWGKVGGSWGDESPVKGTCSGLSFVALLFRGGGGYNPAIRWSRGGVDIGPPRRNIVRREGPTIKR